MVPKAEEIAIGSKLDGIDLFFISFSNFKSSIFLLISSIFFCISSIEYFDSNSLTLSSINLLTLLILLSKLL